MLFAQVLNKKNRALLRELVATDFKLRYQGSILGYLWSLLKPLFLFAILYTVFGYFLKIGSHIEHYPIYLLLGIVLWGFFVEATGQGMTAIIGRGDLIRKVNFPKYVIVLAVSISAFINLGLNLLIVAVFMVFNHVDLHVSSLLFPLVILELYIFAVALAFFLSAAFVKYRDVNHVWEVVLQAMFYATPVIYPISMVLDQSRLAGKLLLLNPIAQIIQDGRYVLVTHQTETLYGIAGRSLLIVVPFAIVLAVTILAAYYFRKSSKYFAENI